MQNLITGIGFFSGVRSRALEFNLQDGTNPTPILKDGTNPTATEDGTNPTASDGPRGVVESRNP